MLDLSTLNPTRDLLLLDTTVREEFSPGGVLMPVPARNTKNTRTTKIGTIVKVGPEANTPGIHKDKRGNNIYFHTAQGFEPGMRVIVSQYASEHLEVDGNRYHFAEASHVMCVIGEGGDDTDKARLDWLEQTILGSGESKFLRSIFITHDLSSEGGLLLDVKNAPVVGAATLRAAIDAARKENS